MSDSCLYFYGISFFFFPVVVEIWYYGVDSDCDAF